MNITLIGMAATGKSVVGKQLADKLGFAYIDTDTLLEQIKGKSIQEILDEIGEEKYLALEGQVLINATGRKDNMIIAPGGSIVYHMPAMDHLHDISTIFYLRIPYEVIEDRLKNLPPRAIIGLRRLGPRALHHERAQLYQTSADHTIDIDDRDFNEVFGTIMRHTGVPEELFPTDV
jgi:shikimate kinase